VIARKIGHFEICRLEQVKNQIQNSDAALIIPGKNSSQIANLT